MNSLFIFCFSQFLTKDPWRRLGAFGNTAAIKRHPFFNAINWIAVLQKLVKPPLGPRSMDVSSSDPVFISSHKHLWVQLHVSGGISSLTASTHLLNDETWYGFWDCACVWERGVMFWKLCVCVCVRVRFYIYIVGLSIHTFKGKMLTVFISNHFLPKLAEFFLTSSEIRCHI